MILPLKKNSRKTYYIDTDKKFAVIEFKNLFSELISKHYTKGKEIIFLCIGTDRATGDSLGPLIGYKLSRLNTNKNIHVYGTLENPVHAQNLSETAEEIYKKFSNPFVIAIDACLGTASHIGNITLGEGALKPGAGVNKELPAVGDMSITGIVNLGGLMDSAILQSTRLSIVMKMADIITNGIWITMSVNNL